MLHWVRILLIFIGIFLFYSFISYICILDVVNKGKKKLKIIDKIKIYLLCIFTKEYYVTKDIDELYIFLEIVIELFNSNTLFTILKNKKEFSKLIKYFRNILKKENIAYIKFKNIRYNGKTYEGNYTTVIKNYIFKDNKIEMGG